MRGAAWGVPVLLICAAALPSAPTALAGYPSGPPAAAPAAAFAPAAAARAASGPPAAAAPAAAPPLATTAPTVTAIWDVDRADPASRDVHLHFVAAACSVVQRVVVEEAADRVVITLDQGGRNGKDCTEPFTRHRTVRLAAPLGARALYDGGASPPALVRAGTST
jgi:hypothetical protein